MISANCSELQIETLVKSLPAEINLQEGENI